MKCMWCLGLLSVALFTLSGQTRAADKVITFEDLPNWTVLNPQNEAYASQGVEFGLSPWGHRGQVATIVPVAAGVARSGTHVLGITLMEGGGEVFVTDVWGHFPISRRKVSMYIGDLGTGTNDVLLTAYTADGTQIQQVKVTVKGGTGIHTPVAIQAGGPIITYFHISTPNEQQQYVHVAIDDLTFDVPASPPPPDFAFNLELPGSVPILPGQSAAAPLILHRMNLSTGNISFKVGGLPQGVSASITPNPDNAGDDSLFTLNLSAAPGATGAQTTLTVTGTPSSPSAGPGPHSIQFPLVVQGTYVLRVKGIEVTQGTQNFGVPSRGPNLSAPIAYSGVQLGPGRTLVRVFADAVGAPAGGVSSVTVLLHGFDTSNNELPGSPLIPQSGPPTFVDSGNAGVTQAEQLNANGSFDFVLPGQWIFSHSISLQAELVPPAPSFDHSETSLPCSDTLCMVFHTLTMNGITFAPTPQPFVYIDPVLLRVDGKPDPPDPITAFAAASLVTPTGLAINPTYVGIVDITDHVTESFSDATSDSWHDLEDWWDDVGGMVSPYTTPAPYFTIGVSGSLDVGQTEAEEDHPIAVTFAGRQLTSVTHELHHCFGRMHASSACGATGSQQGEPWPSDPSGLDPPGLSDGSLNGVGTDLRGSAPFKTLAPRAPGVPVNQCAPSNTGGWPGPNGQWYDFMSYCPCAASADPDTLNSWISPQGWGEFWNNPNPQNLGGAPMQSHVQATLSRAMYPPPASLAARVPVGETLRVRGYVSETGVHIAIVKKVPNGRAFTPPANSDYHLLVRDAVGRTITEVAMATKLVPVMHRAVVTLLRAEVPTKPGIESIAITKDGKVVAERARPQQLPQVKVETPQLRIPPPGVAALPEAPLVLRWQAATAAPNRVSATVDYSIDDGRTWRPLFKGLNRNQVQLPQRLFAGSTTARVRVRIHDGFNEVSTVSNAFTVPSLPPAVYILEPSPGAKLKSGVPVELVGKAVDERMKPIPGASLHWLRNDPASRREVSLGTGERLLVPSLPSGMDLIRLEARDAQGRVGAANVEVNVAANPPQFLVLDSPRILSASARQVQIRVASTVPATTTIREVAGVLFPLPHLVTLPQAAIARGTRVASIPPSLVTLNAHVQIQGTPTQGPYQVGLKPIVITLNIAAGQKPLYFKLDLQAEGLTTTRFIRIGRD